MIGSYVFFNEISPINVKESLIKFILAKKEYFIQGYSQIHDLILP
jgi:hypothetical protein